MFSCRMFEENPKLNSKLKIATQVLFYFTAALSNSAKAATINSLPNQGKLAIEIMPTLDKVHYFNCSLMEPLQNSTTKEVVKFKFGLTSMDEAAENLGFVVLKEANPESGMTRLLIDPDYLSDGSLSNLSTLMGQGGDAAMRTTESGKKVLRLFGDDDGFVFSDLVLYADSNYTKGYYRVSGNYAKNGGWYTSLTCDHQTKRHEFVEAFTKLAEIVASKVKNVEVSIKELGQDVEFRDLAQAELARVQKNHADASLIAYSEAKNVLVTLGSVNIEAELLIKTIVSDDSGDVYVIGKTKDTCKSNAACDFASILVYLYDGLAMEVRMTK